MVRRNPNAGTTLLEVLVVLAIIAMIAALAAPRLMDSFGRAKGQAAEIQLVNVDAALQLYYLDVGSYPTEAEGLGALLEAPSTGEGWQGPYLDQSNLMDPWSRAWIYHQPGSNGRFDLMSLGRDGQPGGNNEDADISR
ncbi:type II secretion system major pseudopilin GspG [Octadecabacter ascidiaceicola]|uniref:Type II secretion system core protein G n=1 Tax=Octadecabacter ascidiaceicola TaxID=1655543 RepID=A0A238K867_9RHOB|nr:type II secretion system major pseudopilin GspG [Octadecabacter ascidiaceicola]SMX38156.1 Type II secretion system protein G precursor [Octadecabacter ascidiaceicola]